MKMKKENKCDINRPRSRRGLKYRKYKNCLRTMILNALSNTQATFEAQFMKKLSNIQAEI